MCTHARQKKPSKNKPEIDTQPPNPAPTVTECNRKFRYLLIADSSTARGVSSTLGHGATISASPFLGSCCHSASVMNGMKGCSSRRHVSNTYTNVRRELLALASASSSASWPSPVAAAAKFPMRVLLASMYLLQDIVALHSGEGWGRQLQRTSAERVFFCLCQGGSGQRYAPARRREVLSWKVVSDA